MLTHLDCSSIKDTVHSISLVRSCQATKSGGLRLSTPFTYSNGEYVDVYLEGRGALVNRYYLSDHGQVAFRLKDSQVGMDSTARKKQILRDITQQLKVDVRSGVLEINLDTETPHDIADAILRLSQACVRVSDFATHQRLRSVNAFRDDVEDFFDGRTLAYVPDIRVWGPYGREIRLDFQVKAGSKTSLVQVLAAMNESSAHNSANEILRKWLEVKQVNEYTAVNYVTVYNSASRAIRPDDLQALRDFSNVVSYPEESDWLGRVLSEESMVTVE